MYIRWDMHPYKRTSRGRKGPGMPCRESGGSIHPNGNALALPGLRKAQASGESVVSDIINIADDLRTGVFHLINLTDPIRLTPMPPG